MSRKKPIFDVLLEDQLYDPAFRAAWVALQPKRPAITALPRLRAPANLNEKEVAEKAVWHVAFVLRLELFPIERERLYVPDLATLQTYAQARGCELGLVFAKPKSRGSRVEVAATAAFGVHQGLRRALAALTRAAVKITRGGQPALEEPTERA